MKRGAVLFGKNLLKQRRELSISRSFGKMLSTQSHAPDYDSYFSDISKLREPSPIRALQPLLKIPGMISLGGGMPNAATFPMTQMSFKLKEVEEPIVIENEELETALQYSSTSGLGGLTQLLGEWQKQEHNCPVPTEICVTTGSQEAVSRAFEMLLNPGDPLLVELPTYSGSLACVNPRQINLKGVPCDDFGLVPEELEKMLSSWSNDQGPKPKVLYTIPVGSNPTGASLTVERKQMIYEVARTHNLIILEDDPYYYLQFCEERIPSFMSIDTDGRVLRFDSFSKILSSGLRMGYATGPKPLIDRIILHGQASSLHPSGISQAVVLKILENWQWSGFLKHVAYVTDFYRERRDTFFQLAEKHLKGLAEWNPHVSAGMFAWIRLLGIEESFDLISSRAVDEKVLLVPGKVFYPLDHGPCPYVRASYSTASPEEMDMALERLARLLKSTPSE